MRKKCPNYPLSIHAQLICKCTHVNIQAEKVALFVHILQISVADMLPAAAFVTATKIILFNNHIFVNVYAYASA